MQNGLQFNVGIIPSMNELMMNNLFYQRYMWFISLLILFFFIFAGLYLLKQSWFDAEPGSLKQVPPGVWPTLKLFLAVGFLTTISSFTMSGLVMALGPKAAGPESLFTLANIIQFRPSRLFFFLIYFGMGLLTYRNHWISRGVFRGTLAIWAVSWAVMLTALVTVRYLMMHGPGEFAEAYGPVYFLILNFVTISTLGFSTSLALRYWNRPRAFDQNMASHSYNIYLGHYAFVIVLQLILLTAPNLPGLIKFGIVGTLAVFLSYGASRFLLKPYPRASITALFGIFLFMLLVVHP